MAQLGQAKPRLLCSLVHKFGKRDVDDFDAFIEQLQSQPSHAAGELFIFVDECHRTQSGKLHKTMKALLPGALFIGFIVDYKDLFKKLVNEKGTGAIQVYTEALDYDQFEAKDCDILMQDRLSKGREWLDNALEALELLCEKVEPPKDDLEHIHYFCGNTEMPMISRHAKCNVRRYTKPAPTCCASTPISATTWTLPVTAPMRLNISGTAWITSLNCATSSKTLPMRKST